MALSLDEAITELDKNDDVRFSRLVTICSTFFGAPRMRGSHHIFRTPWPGDPRVNLQADGHHAKRYQVRQVLMALRKLKG